MIARIARHAPRRLVMWARWRSEVRFEAELHLVRHALSAGDTLVDVGANHGSYTNAALLARANVIAVEPQPGLAAQLADAHRQAVDTGQLTVVTSAVGETEGSAQLWIPSVQGRPIDTRPSLNADANPGYDQTPIDVPVRRLDTISAHADMIKIDVEGHEQQAVAGSWELLQQARPSVLIEVERRHHGENAFAALDMLTSAGWEGLYLRGTSRQLWPLATFDPERDQPDEAAKQPGERAKPEALVNNFLLVHPDRSATLRTRLSRAGWRIHS